MTLVESIYLRYARWSGIALILFACFQFFLGILPGWTEIRSDFPNYYVSGTLLFEGSDSLRMYDNDWFQQKIYAQNIEAAGKFSPFPPPTAFLMAPLTVFEPMLAKRIWLILNLGFIFLISQQIKHIGRLQYRDALLLVLCSGLACANTLMLGQVYLLLLLSMLYSYQLLSSKKNYEAGIVLGVGIAVKYFPLVFVPSLIYERRWKSLASIFLTVALLNLAAALILGLNTYRDFFETVFFQHLTGSLEGQSPWSYAFQSWNALAHNLFRYDMTENPEPLLASETLFNLFKYGIQVSILSIMLWVLYQQKNKSNFFESAIILGSVTVLFLTPAGATYHSLLLLLPFALLAKTVASMTTQFKKIWLVLITSLVLCGIGPLLQSKLPFFNSLLILAFYRLWLMAIIFTTTCYWLIKSENQSS